MGFKGFIDCSANPDYPTAVVDDFYEVSVAGKIGGASGISVGVGDQFIAQVDIAGGAQGAVGAFWVILRRIDDLHSEIKDDLCNIAIDLFNRGRLPKLPSAQSIVNQTIKDQSNVSFPIIWFSIDGEREESAGGTTGSMRRVFPVRVAICARDVVLPQDEAQYTAWRRVLMDAFHQRGINRATGWRLLRALPVCGTTVVPNVVFDTQFLQFKTIVTGFLVKVETMLRRVGPNYG